MPNTSKMQWPYPSRDVGDWYDEFESMIGGMDSSGYAAREDRNLIISGAGDVSFTASTGSLSWSAPIYVFSPIASFRMSIATGSVTLQDGQCLYANVTRSPVSNVALSVAVASQLPNTDSAFMIALRDGSAVYFRNGARVVDGQVGALFAGNQVNHISVLKIATRETHTSDTPLSVGAVAFDPVDYDKPGYTKTMYFRAVAASGAAITTRAQLYNLTDSDLISTLAFTSTAPAKAQQALVQGASAGQIDAVEKIYEVRISLASPSGGPSDTVELYGAEIVIVNSPA